MTTEIRPLTGKTLYSANGEVLGSANGVRGSPRYRANWNGNLFAPPDSGCVLYYPGSPGVGTTIADFSYNFSDSAIDTDEALDAGELAITCDADATAAIPVGSIIRIGTELRKVTATGTTLTTVLYGPSEAHDTNQDIFAWLPNHGTITGATWGRLPSGFRVLNFDGDDYVTLANAASLDILGDMTFLAWVYISSTSVSHYIFIRGQASTDGWDCYMNCSASGAAFVYRTSQAAANQQSYTTDDYLALNSYHLIGISRSGATAVLYANGADTNNTHGTHVNPLTSARTAKIGRYDTATGYLEGRIGLMMLLSGVSQPASWHLDLYAQTRHLFGV